MKRTATLPLLLLMMVALAADGCRGHRTRTNGVTKTETIAPAAAKPAPNGNDAMTQTVDVEDSRSEAEGGIDTMGSAATTTAAPAKSAKAPAKSPKKKR